MPPAKFRSKEEEIQGADDEAAEDEDSDSSDDAADIGNSVLSSNNTSY